MRYNLGSGNDYKFGWVNCDKYSDAKPDIIMDLEQFPWPIDDDSADEVLLSHVLEHLGGHSDIFLSVMKELYRICKPSAKVMIRVPDPRHNDYLSDPTHQRPILPGVFQPLDLALNEEWQSRGLPGTPLAKYLKIDFPTVSVTQYLDPHWLSAWQDKSITDEGLTDAVRSSNNVVQWSEIVLEAKKPFSPGRSLKKLDALVIKRTSGMGDVLMALSALSAVKKTVGLPVFIETSQEYEELATRCPAIDGVFVDSEAMISFFKTSKMVNIKYIDWSPAQFGVSRLHQVDAFLMSLGVTLLDASKGVDMIFEQETIGCLDSIPDGHRRVVLHPGITDPNRTWPRELWSKLAEDLIASGDVVIVIGSSQSKDGRCVASLSHPLIIDLIDQLTMEQTIGLLRQCDVLISGDSGPIQLAGASDIAIIGLYSVVNGENRLPYRSGSFSYKAKAISPSCAFHPCYPRINDADSLARFCAEEKIAPTDTQALFAHWCVNPDRYSCVRDSDIFDRVKDALVKTSDLNQPKTIIEKSNAKLASEPFSEIAKGRGTAVSRSQSKDRYFREECYIERKSLIAHKPETICVATSYTENFREIGDNAAIAIKNYAHFNDTSYYVDGRIDFVERPSPWHRLRLIPKLFSKGVEFVLWMDADATFVRYDIDIRSVIRSGKDVYLTQHRIGDRLIPNTGVLLLRNSPWTLTFIDDLWSLAQYTHHPWWDNAAMIHMLGRHRLLGAHADINDQSVLDHVEFLSTDWNNLPGICESVNPIILHYAGRSNEDRKRELSRQTLRGFSTVSKSGRNLSAQSEEVLHR